MRTDIDRKSYGVASDLQATSGSISDALRNVPSVQVDVQGNVTLRGDSNVEIMIDGKPSGMFRGEGKGAALQGLPADQIERVEVLTNPSAAFNPEGSAGVINLVTKKNRRLGNSGSVRANVGSNERWNAGVSGSRNDGKLTLSGDLSFRHDTQKLEQISLRQRLDTASGQFLENRADFVATNRVDMVFARAGVDYDPDAKTRITAGVHVHAFRPRSNNFDHIEYDGPGGALARVLDRVTGFEQERANIDTDLSWRRKFDGEEHELVVELGRTWNLEDRDRGTTNFARRPAAADLFETVAFDGEQVQTDFEVDYTRPMPGEAKLKLGYDLQIDDNLYDSRGRRGANPAILPVAAPFTYAFLFDQMINAAYLTYQRPFGDLTVLAGLRVEDVRIEVNLRGDPVRTENNYTGVYPSLHLSQRLDDKRQLTAGYSRRIQRPRPDDLNPFLIEQDPFNFRRGNPRLEPQETDSFELGYQHRDGGTTYLGTLYYRQSTKGVADVVRDLGNGVYLSTRENLRESRAGGLELVANGRLTPKITYNISGNAAWTELDASQLGFTGTRSGYSLSGRGNLSWQVTANDFLQVNGFANGNRLTPQGHEKGFAMLNLGYRRKLNDRLSAVLTVQDVLGSFRQIEVLDTPILRGQTERKFNQRGVFVGFNWTFGRQSQRRDPAFDFGSGGPPAT